MQRVYFYFFALLLTATISSATSGDWNNGNAYVPPASSRGWPQWGRDWWNSHYQPNEKRITAANVNRLTARCSFNITGKGLWGQPTTVGDQYLYFTAGNCLVYAIDRFDCSVIWTYNVSAFLHSSAAVVDPIAVGINGFDSRSSPAIYRNSVYIGTRAGAYLLKINRFTGIKSWHVKVDNHPLAQITMSPILDHQGRVIVGVSSNEELATSSLAGPPVNYRCCSFQGSVNAFSSDSGARLWRTLTLPDNGGVNGGFAGAAVWGSAAAIDTDNDMLYVATGNLYIGPPEVEQCRNLTSDGAVVSAYGRNWTLSNYEQRDPCRLESGAGKCGDCSESVVAMRLSDGYVDWSSPKGDVDSYVVACGLSIGRFQIPRNSFLCPQTPGPDYDFGQAPAFVPRRSNSPGKTAALFVGQKSGLVWGTNARSGQNLWSSAVSPGGKFGGLQWGSATDGQRYYYSATNSEGKNMTITYQGQNITINYASFGALNITTGDILWQTPSPTKGTGQSTLAVANGVVFIGGRDDVGALYALDASNGNILWSVRNNQTSQMATTLPGDGTVISVGGYQSTSGRLTIYALPGYRPRTMDDDNCDD